MILHLKCHHSSLPSLFGPAAWSCSSLCILKEPEGLWQAGSFTVIHREGDQSDSDVWLIDQAAGPLALVLSGGLPELYA